jgi:aminoglycoside N3'-acetyltransferase
MVSTPPLLWIAIRSIVILLGAGEERASFIYLAQFMSGIGREIRKSAPILVDGGPKWVEYRDMAVDNRLVSSGTRFLVREGVARTGHIGDAPSIIFGCRQALGALLEWAWRDVDFPITFDRQARSVPKDWSVWLE